MGESNMGRGIVGLVAGIGLTLVAQHYADKDYDFRIFGMNKRYIPDVTQVQEGFVAPSDIERITNENVDTRSPEPETYATIKGEKYALVWNDNAPQLLQYGIQVVPIVPAPVKQDTTNVDTTKKSIPQDSSGVDTVK